ncbi:hypothetical protein BD770DRAFT_448390 [Pilaira anomala]|nr:hypothetical protein BD770DRAFT_448390 [Pilaira anomala]
MTGRSNLLDISNKIKITIEEGLIIPVTARSLEEYDIFEIFCYTQDPEMKILLKMKKSTATNAYEDFFQPTKVKGLPVTVHGNILSNAHGCVSVFVNDITISSTPIPIPTSIKDELGLVDGLLVPQQQETEISRDSKDSKMKVSNILDVSIDLDQDIKFDDNWKHDKEIVAIWDDKNDFDVWNDHEQDYSTESLSDKFTEFSNKIYDKTTTFTEEEGQASTSLVLGVESNTDDVQYNAITVEFTEVQDISNKPIETEVEKEVIIVPENNEAEKVVTVVKPTEDINTLEPTEDINAIEPTEDINAIKPTEDINAIGPTEDITIVEPTEDMSTIEPTEDKRIMITAVPIKVEDHEAIMDTDHFEQENTLIVEVMDTMPPDEPSISAIENPEETESTDQILDFQKEQQATTTTTNQQEEEGLMQHVVLHESSSIGKSTAVIHLKRKRKSKMPVDPTKLRRSPRLALKKRVQYFPPKRVRRLLKNS